MNNKCLLTADKAYSCGNSSGIVFIMYTYLIPF